MATKIEWCKSDDGKLGETWNPITGCSKISEGCQNCYAARMAKRLAGRCGYPKENPFAVTFHPDRLEQPSRWKKPRRIFVCSMSDLFHEDVTNSQIHDVFEQAINAQWIFGHTFIFLTKRPERMKRIIEAIGEELREQRKDGMSFTFPLRNIWLGVTAENQRTADERIPILLQIPAAVRFVSCEPLLGPIDLTDLHYQNTIGINALKGSCGVWEPHTSQEAPGLDWVVTGGETGPKARPMEPRWARSIWAQCQDAQIPFFFKKWGSSYSHTPGIFDPQSGTYDYDYYGEVESTRQFPEVKR